MHRRLTEIAFSSIVTAIFLWSALASLSWSFKAALFPAAIGVAFLLLTLLHISRFVFGTQSVNSPRTERTQSPSMEGNDYGVLESGDPLTMLGWLGGYFLGIIGLGFELASVVFFLLFMKMYGREKWWITLACTILGWLLVKMLFVEILHVPFPKGWLMGKFFDSFSQT